MTNPLLQPWTAPYGLPPFETARIADYGPAIEAALGTARARIAAIAGSGEVPGFDNTIAALELSSQELHAILGAFWTLASAATTDEIEALERDLAPRLAAYRSEITGNRALFARIDALWQGRDGLELNPEQARVLHLTHRDFTRAGAELEGAEAERLKAIKARLAELTTAFGQNVLHDERTWQMPLGEDGLDGLPGFVVAGARSAGEERGAGGPVVTLSRSLIVPFLQFSPRRDLRQKAFRAWVARGENPGAHDNRPLVAEILGLRAEMAGLLGWTSYADWNLDDEMAKTPAAVRGLLEEVRAPARKAALADAQVLEAMLLADGLPGPLEPWDWRYYAQKRRLAEHDLDEAALKPYFQLDRMIEAVFSCANRLFGLEFAPTEGPRYHPDVRMWEVTRGGEHVALFIGDYFARASKHSGAWCSDIRAQQRLAGETRPIVINVCNFAKPPAGAPALLSWDDARTLFHEFGHALHQMLSDVTYESISGTSVPRDFVELPSQLFEHWLEVPEVLDQFATHVETGAPMPAELRERLLAARTFDMGFSTVEFIASAMVDLAFHEGPPPADPVQKQAEILEEMGMPRAITMRHATPNFGHIFAGGYAAGYYSYMWSEVMDADAFAAFEEKGDPFDPELAASLEANILSRGGSEDPAVLYTRFRGRMPGVAPLLKGRGLLPGE